MKFGFDQLFKPTPEQARKVFNSFLVITSVVSMVFQFFPQIPKVFTSEVNTYIIDANGFVFALSRMFGVSVDKPKLDTSAVPDKPKV